MSPGPALEAPAVWDRDTGLTDKAVQDGGQGKERSHSVERMRTEFIRKCHL